jgi:hypothetical protein
VAAQRDIPAVYGRPTLDRPESLVNSLSLVPAFHRFQMEFHNGVAPTVSAANDERGRGRRDSRPLFSNVVMSNPC